MSILDNSLAPSTSTMIAVAQELYHLQGEDAVMEYFYECAAHDFQCPDRCANWAVDFFNDNEEEITGTEPA